MHEMRVQSQDWEDLLEKEMATPVILAGEFHGQKSLEGYSPWGHRELDMTEQLNTHMPHVVLGKTLERPLGCKEVQPIHPEVLGVLWKD